MNMPRGGRQSVERDRSAEIPAVPQKARRRCNSLDGKRWLQNSISVWSDIRKSAEELRLKHPALFPAQLVERLIESFLPAGVHRILDPFAGVGSTLVAAQRLGKEAFGLELSPEFCSVARGRLPELEHAPSEAPSPQRSPPKRGRGSEDHASSSEQRIPSGPSPIWKLHEASAARLLEFVPPDSVDLCVTSPPYWNILLQKRTADYKAVRHYGNRELDLGTIADYDAFLTALTAIFVDVLAVLKPGAHCCIVVMDLRKKNRFYPLHSDLAARLVQAGYLFDDLIIWNRQSEYNNLRPLGYPAVFRVNKVHEFILLMQKATR